MRKTYGKTDGGHRRLFGVITVIGGVIFGALILEIGLRIVGYSSPEFYTADGVRGYGLIPQMKGWYNKEGRSYVSINSDGFRDVEHQISKPNGTVRIAILGDSYVEALQVGQDEIFTNFLANEIEKCGAFNGKHVEMLNFGVSGYGTAQELLTLRDKVWKYSPDIVMLVMTTNNDISDNLRAFKRTPIPYFVNGENGLVLDNSFSDEKTFVLRNSAISRLGIWLKNHLRFVQALGAVQVTLKYRYQEWKNKGKAGAEGSPSGEIQSLSEIGIDNQIYLTPSNENWDNAWKVTERIIAQMEIETKEKGAKFIVITASNGVQVLPAIEQRGQFAKTLMVNDLYYPDRRIAEFCTNRPIPVITLAPVLAEYAARENVNLHGFEGNIGYGHWNQLGHRVAGTAIGKNVCSGILGPIN